MEILISLVAVLLILLVVIFYSSFSWGLVTFKFWYWFILPIFTGLPELTFYQCMGLFFFIGLFKNHSGNHIKDEYKDNNDMYTNLIISPWITLLIGYIIKCWFLE